VFSNLHRVDDFVSSFDSVLTKIFESAFPLKTVTISSRDKPWVSPHVKLLMQQKDKAFHRGHVKRYFAIRERLQKAILIAKKKFFANVNTTNPKQSWKLVNSLLKAEKGSSSSMTQDLVNELNTKYASALKRMTSLSYLLMSLKPHDIKKVMLTIKSNAAGPDGIPGGIYRKYADYLSYPLTIIINASLRQSTVPSAWKKAHITPIPKGRSKTDFRPISLLPFGSKVLEKLFLHTCIVPLAGHLFNKNQFAFVPNKFQGTTTALTLFRLSILNNFPNCDFINCITIDFLKAFDKISHHTILTAASQRFSLQSNHIQWLKSFLTDRQQRVITNNCSSKWMNCSSGVPQGSILGPTLFAMVLNSFNVKHSNSNLILYADDLTIIHSVSKSCPDNSQEELNNLVSWSNSNHLFLNPLKCAVMTISKGDQSSSNLYLQGQKLKDVSEIKLLGVWFSNKLNFSRQGDYIVRKCSSGMAAINKLHRSGVNGAILWRAYLALVFSHICYCWPAIVDLPQKYMRKFEQFERRACKLSSRPSHHNSCSTRLNNICLKLMENIKKHSDHPLRSCFTKINAGSLNLRTKTSLIPTNHSTRLLRSFAKFYH